VCVGVFDVRVCVVTRTSYMLHMFLSMHAKKSVDAYISMGVCVCVLDGGWGCCYGCRLYAYFSVCVLMCVC